MACEDSGGAPSQCDALFVDGGPTDAIVDAAMPEAAAAHPDGAASSDAVADAPADVAMDTATPVKDATVVETGAPDAAFDAGLSAGVRVANWSPDTPAVDFCLGTPGSSAFRGPILKNSMPDAGILIDGGVVGLTFPGVSAYKLVPAGPFVVRIVAALDTDCSVPIPTFPDLTPGDAGATPRLLIALLGNGSGHKLASFVDDVNPASSSNLAVRFIHAAPGVGSLTFGTGDPTSVSALFSGVAYGQASLAAATLPDGGSGPSPDANGFLQRSAFLGVQLSAVSSAASEAGPTTFATTSSPFSAAAGAVVTFAAVGTSSSPGLLACIDNAGTTGLYSNCSVLGP